LGSVFLENLPENWMETPLFWQDIARIKWLSRHHDLDPKSSGGMRSHGTAAIFKQREFLNSNETLNPRAASSLSAFCLLSDGGFKQISAQTQTAAGAAPDRILAAFRSKETEFHRLLNGYGFKRDAVIQSIGMGGQVTGEYHRVSYITFDSQGKMREKIITFPLPTLTLDPADLEDLNTIEIFAVEAGKFDRYQFTYVGRERVDELDTYVFDVAPKVMPESKKSKERFFMGRIWIDDRDMQLVKAKGKGVPEGKQRFAVFETYREQLDAGYWFPTLTYADDKLVLSNGQVLRIRMRIRFTDFEHPPTQEMIPTPDMINSPPAKKT
jgi:hypothetical protein